MNSVTILGDLRTKNGMRKHLIFTFVSLLLGAAIYRLGDSIIGTLGLYLMLVSMALIAFLAAHAAKTDTLANIESTYDLKKKEES